MTNLLIIEDEAALLNSMVSYLEPAGYHCTTARSYTEALRVIDLHEYACVLVDLTLPDGDGMQIIRLLKENRSRSGIIIVSSRDALDDRITGLQTGADDYLIKPFHLSELNARIQSVIRRLHFRGEVTIRFRELVIDPEGKSVSCRGERLDLTKKEYEILVYLVINKNRVVTKDSIAEHLYGETLYGTEYSDAVYSHIKNLRKKIQSASGSDYIETIYGVGYKIQEAE